MNVSLLSDATTILLLATPEILIPVILGGVSLFLLQIGMGQAQTKFKLALVGLGIVLLLGSFAFHFMDSAPTLPKALQLAFGMLSVFGAVGLLSFREPIHAALGFAVAVLSTAGIFLLQAAPFIAASTIIVYVGATIIIFLFVLMFAQSTHPQIQDVRLTSPILAIFGGMLLLLMIQGAISTLPIAALPERAPQRVVDLGRVMYTDYLYAVEIAGTLLLIATVGAISLGQKKRVGRTTSPASSLTPPASQRPL